VGEQLLTIDVRQHNWLEAHRTRTKSRYGYRREHMKDRYGRAVPSGDHEGVIKRTAGEI
jgi:hypothetical protein